MESPWAVGGWKGRDGQKHVKTLGSPMNVASPCHPRGLLGPSWSVLETFLGRVGAKMASLGALLGRLGAHLCSAGSVLDARRAIVGAPPA
eukprot:5401615-Pyramimonas_sp.AAC.1